jgi:hypothetical protein
MPYILNDRFALIENNPERAKEPGDWNALYSVQYARILKERGVKYSTLHFIATCVEKTGNDRIIHELTMALSAVARPTELLVARQEALHELRRRVFFKYEDDKAADTKNIDPYEEFVGRPQAKPVEA